MPRIPLIEDLTTTSVPPGSNILVEFDPASQWYNASLTIAAGWIRAGGRVTYNVTSQAPDNIRTKFRRLGLEVEELEESGRLSIADWYTATLGQKSKEKLASDSLRVADLSIEFSRVVMRRPIDPERLRIVDDLSTLGRYNDDKAWVEFVLTRELPSVSVRNSMGIRGIARGVQSEWIYKRLEAAHDGIVDFNLEEGAEQTRDVIRVRSMQNVGFDRRWHPLKIDNNFEVTIEK